MSYEDEKHTMPSKEATQSNASEHAQPSITEKEREAASQQQNQVRAGPAIPKLHFYTS